MAAKDRADAAKTRGIHAFFRGWQLQERQKKTRLVRLEKQSELAGRRRSGLMERRRNAEQQIGKKK